MNIYIAALRDRFRPVSTDHVFYFPVETDFSLLTFSPSSHFFLPFFIYRPLSEPDLILYQTILSFNNRKNKAFWKHCGKRRNCW